jgi:hypothetical protein
VLLAERGGRVPAEAAAELDELVSRVDAGDEETLKSKATRATGDHVDASLGGGRKR